MAYNESLAQRVRSTLDELNPFGLTEKKMFGGIAYLLRGNMACGVHGDGIIVRLSEDAHSKALSKPGVRPFDLTGRPMKGWIVVDASALNNDAALRSWVKQGLDFAATLPAK